MIKRVLAGAFAGGLVMLGTTACNYVDPCTQIAPPTKEQIAAANIPNTEVETELENGIECDLINGRWQREDSSS